MVGVWRMGTIGFMYVWNLSEPDLRGYGMLLLSEPGFTNQRQMRLWHLSGL